MADYCASPVTLTLSIPNGPTVDLMSDQQGFRVSEFDPGYPDVREDVNARPGQHGTIDLTRLFGPRAVTITGALVPSPAGSRQQAWHALAPFLDPGARPVLTYQVDADAAPRTLTVRAGDVSGPMSNPTVSDFHMGFKAADPLAYDATVKTAILRFGGLAGRAYNLIPPRAYPAGVGNNQASARNYGDFTTWPVLRFYGPMTAPLVNGDAYAYQGDPGTYFAVQFVPSFVINAGDYVEVDCRRRTAYRNGDPGQSVYSSLYYSSLVAWPYIPPTGPGNYGFSAFILQQASGTSSASQVQIVWQDAYLL